MKGYVARKGDRFLRGRLRRNRPRDRAGTAHLAHRRHRTRRRRTARSGAQRPQRRDRSLTFGAYLTRQWLPGKRVVLATSTHAGYRRNIERQIVPALGRIGLRRLRPHPLETLYDNLLRPGEGSVGLAPKTVYEIYLVIRGALEDAVRRGLVTRNVALVAHAPRLRAIPKIEQRSWTAEELQVFLRAAAGHRLFAALWTAAFTGMRRNELLGLSWDDFDPAKATLSINRGLVAIGYELHETRGKTRNARRRIDLDPTTNAVLTAWRTWQTAEQHAIGVDPSSRMFTDGHGETIHPHAISQTFERIARRADVSMIHLHDLRHTHGTLLIAAGVPVKAVSERLGHARLTFTIETYQHV